MRNTATAEEIVLYVKITVIVEEIVQNVEMTAIVEEIIHNLIKTATTMAVCLITSLTSESSSSSVYLFDKINQKKMPRMSIFCTLPSSCVKPIAIDRWQ